MKNMVGPMSGVMIARWLDYSLPSDLRGEQGSAQSGDAPVCSPNSLLQRAANRVFLGGRLEFFLASLSGDEAEHSELWGDVVVANFRDRFHKPIASLLPRPTVKLARKKHTPPTNVRRSAR